MDCTVIMMFSPYMSGVDFKILISTSSCIQNFEVK